MCPIHRRTNPMLQYLPRKVTYRVNTLNFTFLDTRRKGTDSTLNYINQLIYSDFFVSVILLLSLPNILILPHFPMTYQHLSVQRAVIMSQFVVSIISSITLTYITLQTGTFAFFTILPCTLVSSRPCELYSLTLKFATFLSVFLIFKSQLLA